MMKDKVCDVDVEWTPLTVKEGFDREETFNNIDILRRELAKRTAENPAAHLTDEETELLESGFEAKLTQIGKRHIESIGGKPLIECDDWELFKEISRELFGKNG